MEEVITIMLLMMIDCWFHLVNKQSANSLFIKSHPLYLKNTIKFVRVAVTKAFWTLHSNTHNQKVVSKQNKQNRSPAQSPLAPQPVVGRLLLTQSVPHVVQRRV
jgi:hypothetical protein